MFCRLKRTPEQIKKDIERYSKEVGLLDKASYEQFYSIAKNPEALTNELVQLIGDCYLKKYPIKKGRFANLFHGNQSLALELKNCDKADPYQRWLLLRDVYEKLPVAEGKLSTTMIMVIASAFDVAFYWIAGNFGPLYTPVGIAMQMSGAITDYYFNQFVSLLLRRRQSYAYFLKIGHFWELGKC